MAAATHLFSVIPVEDAALSTAWYSALFDRSPDDVVGDEIMWSVTETAWLVVTERKPAGTAQLTLAVDGFDEMLGRMLRHGAAHEIVEQYGNGVRHVVIVDPDGNRIALAGS